MITWQLLLPESVCKILRKAPAGALSNIIDTHLKEVKIRRFLWKPEVETYIEVKIEKATHRNLVDEAMRRKVSSVLLFRNIIYTYVR